MIGLDLGGYVHKKQVKLRTKSHFSTSCMWYIILYFAFYRILCILLNFQLLVKTQSAITCSKLIIETLEQGVKYVQKLAKKTAERRTPCSSVSIVNFERVNAYWECEISYSSKSHGNRVLSSD